MHSSCSFTPPGVRSALSEVQLCAPSASCASSTIQPTQPLRAAGVQQARRAVQPSDRCASGASARRDGRRRARPGDGRADSGAHTVRTAAAERAARVASLPGHVSHPQSLAMCARAFLRGLLRPCSLRCCCHRCFHCCFQWLTGSCRRQRLAQFAASGRTGSSDGGGTATELLLRHCGCTASDRQQGFREPRAACALPQPRVWCTPLPLARFGVCPCCRVPTLDSGLL